MIKDKSIVFLDDSIVRGTQLKDNTIDFRNAGARELHMRIACPPLTFSCDFLNFSQSRSTKELATRKAIIQLEGEERDLEKYANPESDKYQDMGDLLEAIGLPKEKLCSHCWDGTSRF